MIVELEQQSLPCRIETVLVSTHSVDFSAAWAQSGTCEGSEEPQLFPQRNALRNFVVMVCNQLPLSRTDSIRIHIERGGLNNEE
jgi:hypothetical protein